MARSSPHKPQAARRAVLEIGEIGAQGDGVALLDGEPVFVPLTAPGDRAVVDIRGDRGTLVETLDESPHRAPPPCPHYGVCGGCALQHVNADFYRDWKRERVVEALRRAGVEAPVEELTATPAASRRRATFTARQAKDGAIIGFKQRRTRDVAPVEACLVLHPTLQAALPKLRAFARAFPANAFRLSVTLCDNGFDIDIGGDVEEPRGADLERLGKALEAAGGLRFSLHGEALLTLRVPLVDFDGMQATPPPGGFLQASREGEAALLALVREATRGARRIADLFCGCGAFALPLAREATVFAADADKSAIAALAAAAAHAQAAGVAINPVRTEARDLFVRPLSAQELNRFDAVIFDPPRAGAAAQAEALAKSPVPAVAAVSCNPATFARDAAILIAGGYRLVRVTPVDQFVYSPHIELAAAFVKG